MLAVLASVAVVGAFAQPAGAYGKLAQWQVGFSFNCDNPTPGACDQFGGTGGFWGWYEFDSDGTGDATLTFCGHTGGGGGGGGGGAGAGHENVDIESWTIQDGDFWILDASDSTVEGDTGIPAIPGHHSLNFGPGISGQVQVTLIPNR